jgi:hypothetical protein
MSRFEIGFAGRVHGGPSGNRLFKAARSR